MFMKRRESVDWPKIKKILIIVLTITNVFMISAYILQANRFQPASDDAMTDMQRLYQAKKIRFTQKIPNLVEQMNGYEISYHTFNVNDVDRLLKTYRQVDPNLYKNTQETIYVKHATLVLNDNDCSPHWMNVKKMAQIKDEKGYEAIALQAIRERLVYLDYVVSELYQVEGGVLLEMTQLIDGVRSDESRALVYFVDDHPVGMMLQSIIYSKAITQKKYDIISLSDAMFIALGDIVADDELLDIQLVYKLNRKEMSLDIVEGEALPFYKFIFQKQPPVYVPGIK